ncbi:carbohydrate ABC transporter permease [Sphaerisporangium album]|uniref:Carbohydrate ABC transporter permease n=1 Tax=Sphaerisporangium album TaxID=509200 RepID=A0A367FRJ4_9ACTN|nr:carbohydrate ABC transporter permease [Sphaerisporangium album]RCG32529.1 carbohydrate ABC transporter permease [Sphaerisporangium album]
MFDTALGWGWGRRHPVASATRLLLYAAVVVVFCGPLLAVFSGAFDAGADPSRMSLIPHDPTLENFQVAAEQGLWHFFLNSVVIAGGALLLQVAVSVFAAYALARKRFRGQALVLLAILATMMLPEEIIAIPLSLVLGDLPLLHLDLRGSLLGVILPLGGWGFSIFVMSEFMKEIPAELEEAARVDGASEMRIFGQIILPLCRPALGVIVIFGFTMIWDQYLLPLIVAETPDDYTLTVALASLRSDPSVGPGALLAGSLLALLPSLAVYLAFQRTFMSGLVAGAVKG